jgi:hypothetical protein
VRRRQSSTLRETRPNPIGRRVTPKLTRETTANRPVRMTATSLSWDVAACQGFQRARSPDCSVRAGRTPACSGPEDMGPSDCEWKRRGRCRSSAGFGHHVGLDGSGRLMEESRGSSPVRAATRALLRTESADRSRLPGTTRQIPRRRLLTSAERFESFVVPTRASANREQVRFCVVHGEPRSC